MGLHALARIAFIPFVRNFSIAARVWLASGSDVVSVSQTSHLEAADYVGQASRATNQGSAFLRSRRCHRTLAGSSTLQGLIGTHTSIPPVPVCGLKSSP
jgi:hypothetical protein